MRALWVAGVWLLVSSSACTSAKEAAPKSFVATLANSSVVACETGVPNVPSGSPLVADSVFFSTTALVPEPSGDAVLPFFAKAGLWVRSRAAARLTVVAPAGVRIGWGSAAPHTEQVTVPACQHPGAQWLVWPGGFWVPGPTCVTLRVEAQDDDVVVQVPVGSMCD